VVEVVVVKVVVTAAVVVAIGSSSSSKSTEPAFCPSIRSPNCTAKETLKTEQEWIPRIGVEARATVMI
jgi:hypothetical protein